MERKQFALRLNSELFDRTQALADRAGLSMNTLVASAVSREVERVSALMDRLDLRAEREPQP